MTCTLAPQSVTAYVNIYHRIIICPRHWPPACLRGWAEFNFAGKSAVVGDCHPWKYFMWTSSADATYSSKTIRSIFTGEMLKLEPIWFAFRANLSASTIHRRCAGNPLGQIAYRCQLQPATTSQVGRRDMRTRLTNCSRSHNLFWAIFCSVTSFWVVSATCEIIFKNSKPENNGFLRYKNTKEIIILKP